MCVCGWCKDVQKIDQMREDLDITAEVIDFYRPDIVVLVETWLKGDEEDLCTHLTSHNTIGQCLLYNLSHTAASLVLYAVDKGLRGRNVLQSLLLILLRICSRSIRPR